MKHINLDLIRATEAAAIAASKWIGSGKENKIKADKAATDAMRYRLNQLPFAGRIITGEGKKDNSYGLFAGEFVGEHGRDLNDNPAQNNMPYLYDIALDPIDGTSQTVIYGQEAMSVMAIAEQGTMANIDTHYMNKLAYRRDIAQKANLDIKEAIEITAMKVAAALDKDISEIVVCMLDRPRHANIISKLRKAGVRRIKLIPDCDVSAAIGACLPKMPGFPDSDIDLLYGVGGAPECLITACALKALGAGFQAQIAEVNEADVKLDDQVYDLNNLITGNCMFVATGITDGNMLKGVRMSDGGTIATHSVLMRSESGTIRWLDALHRS